METKNEQLEAAKSLINYGYAGYLAKHIDKFPLVDQKWAVKQIIKSGNEHSVGEYIQNFKNIDKIWITDSLIKNGKGLWSLAGQLKKLKHSEIDEVALINKIIQTKDRNSILDFLDYYTKLDKKLFLNAIFRKQSGLNEIHIEKIIHNLDEFKVVDIKKLIIDIIDANGIYIIMNNVKKVIEFLDDYKRFITLIMKKRIDITRNLDLFKNADHQWIVNELIKYPKSLANVPENINKFHNIDKQKLIEKVLEQGNYRQVQLNLKKMTDIDQIRLKTKLENRAKKMKEIFNLLGVNPSDLGY